MTETIAQDATKTAPINEVAEKTHLGLEPAKKSIPQSDIRSRQGSP